MKMDRIADPLNESLFKLDWADQKILDLLDRSCSGRHDANSAYPGHFHKCANLRFKPWRSFWRGQITDGKRLGLNVVTTEEQVLLKSVVSVADALAKRRHRRSAA